MTNSGEGRTRYVAREDCAASAAAVLLGGDHAGRAYDIAGPESLDARALAGIVTEAGGGAVEPVLVDDAVYVEGLVAAGLPRELAESLATLGMAARGGRLDAPASDVESLTGRPPRDLASFLREHRDALTG